MRIVQFLSAAVLAASCFAAEFPQAEISNSVATVKFYLPDAENGYYRGTRFDWSGQIYSLKTLGHEYFGQWFERYDPKLHDAIMGPVEDFRTGETTLNYDEAPVGGTFYRIGVGALRKPDDRPFQPFRTYDILNNGKWTVKTRHDSIEFTQEMNGDDGYAWRYTKTIRLVKNKPEMTIEHTLKNTGTKPLETQQYNHNFFVIDGQPTGPGVTVRFPFDLKPVKPFANDTAQVQASTIVYKHELEKGQSVYAQFEGAEQYEVHMEHGKAGAGVRITGDRPIQKLVYWSIRTTFCPEAYVDVSAQPGRESKWKYTYTFYTLPPSGAASR